MLGNLNKFAEWKWSGHLVQVCFANWVPTGCALRRAKPSLLFCMYLCPGIGKSWKQQTSIRQQVWYTRGLQYVVFSWSCECTLTWQLLSMEEGICSRLPTLVSIAAQVTPQTLARQSGHFHRNQCDYKFASNPVHPRAPASYIQLLDQPDRTYEVPSRRKCPSGCWIPRW